VVDVGDNTKISYILYIHQLKLKIKNKNEKLWNRLTAAIDFKILYIIIIFKQELGFLVRIGKIRQNAVGYGQGRFCKA
jgi:hypothetical protein